jgi:myo-inositol 2-dehydrogenase / D-chiro-inositol 1-dehydrogenase
MSEHSTNGVSRREFIQTGAVVTAGLVIPHWAYASGSDTLKVGLIGCGGRGTGGIVQCMQSSPGVELIAVGDLVPDRIARARKSFSDAVAANRVPAAALQLKDDQCFTGFDAYKRVLATDVQYVMLATPPGFRPLHLAASIDAGKHVFAEKPVATDAAGIRSCLATYEKALQKGLGIGVGTQRRHNAGYQDVMNRVRDGQIGEVLGGQVYWNQGGLWHEAKKPEYTDSEWQIRNWLYFTWLSGDHIVEQHVHNIDVANWVMGGPPVRAIGVGGRVQRVKPEYGHIYDHFSIDFEYANGVHIHSMCRQIERGAQSVPGRVGEWFQGSLGKLRTAENGPYVIEGKNAHEWTRPDNYVNPMVQEHGDLISSVRAGKPRNDLKRICESVLTAMMGREAAYTGGTIQFDALMAAKQDLAPGPLADVKFGPMEVPPVALPGRTKLERGFVEGW